MNELAPLVDRGDAAQALSRVITEGDLSRLTPEQRVTHYNATCQSIGLNPLTRPLEYITLNGKLVLYARKDCTDQLRSLRNVSVEITDRTIKDGLIIVSARARMPDGRTDEDIGVVPMPSGAGEIKANAVMKAITKSKRRVTLSICGLGFLDESEIEGAIAGDAERREPPRDVPNKAAREEAPPPAADSTDLPILTPAGILTSVPATVWPRAVRKALDMLESRPAVVEYRRAMGPHLGAIAAASPARAAMVAEAERMISDRLDEMAPREPEPADAGEADFPGDRL